MKDRERRRIDWDAVRARLADSAAPAEADPARLEAIYRERAEALARRAAAAGPAPGRRVLVVVAGGERYGIDFGDVAEVLPFAGCTPVPGGPPHLLGVMNVRGDIRSVADLAAVLGASGAAGEGGYVVAVRGRGGRLCLRVGAVDAVRPVPPGGLTPPDDGGAAFPHLAGVTADGLRVLDTDRVLAAGGPETRPAEGRP